MPAMFLATTYDRTSEAWTKFSPNRSCLFLTPLNNYDAVVLLHRDKLSYPQRLRFPAEINHGKHVIWGKASKDFQPYIVLGNAFKSLEDARNKLLVDFDPTRYFLEDLKGELPEAFQLWYDSFGGDAIGLTWERKVSKKRSRDEVDESSKEPIKLLKDVGHVGKGYVKSVYFLKAPKLQG